MRRSLHPKSARQHAAARVGIDAAGSYRLLAPHYDRILGHFRRPFEALRDRVLGDWLPERSPPAAAADDDDDAPLPVHADLGCGTGTVCLQMAWRGWRSHGLDLSADMIAAAGEKLALVRRTPPAILSWLAASDHARLRRLPPAQAQAALRRPLQADFAVGDLRDFTLPDPADFITWLFDTINHLPRQADLPVALAAIARNLRPGGLALVDANSTQAVREVWPAMKPEVHGDDESGYFTVLQGGAYDPRDKSCTLTWTWFLRRPDGAWDRVEEQYREIAWTPTQWRQAIRQAGLKMRFLQDAARLAAGFDPGWRHAILLEKPA